MNDDLWVTSSTDHEAVDLERRLTIARLAAAPVWPFLAAATSAGDYANRTALSADRIARVATNAADGDPVMFSVVHSALLAGFEADFEALHGARVAEARTAALTARRSARKTATSGETKEQWDALKAAAGSFTNRNGIGGNSDADVAKAAHAAQAAASAGCSNTFISYAMQVTGDVVRSLLSKTAERTDGTTSARKTALTVRYESESGFRTEYEADDLDDAVVRIKSYLSDRLHRPFLAEEFGGPEDRAMLATGGTFYIGSGVKVTVIAGRRTATPKGVNPFPKKDAAPAAPAAPAPAAAPAVPPVAPAAPAADPAADPAAAEWTCPACQGTDAYTQGGKDLDAALAEAEPIKCGDCGAVDAMSGQTPAAAVDPATGVAPVLPASAAPVAPMKDVATPPVKASRLAARRHIAYDEDEYDNSPSTSDDFNGGSDGPFDADMQAIERRDPDGTFDHHPTDADYRAFRDWAESNYPAAAKRYFSSRHQAQVRGHRPFGLDRVARSTGATNYSPSVNPYLKDPAAPVTPLSPGVSDDSLDGPVDPPSSTDRPKNVQQEKKPAGGSTGPATVTQGFASLSVILAEKG